MNGATTDREQGTALVLAVFVMALLTGLGTALLFLSQQVMRTSRASLLEKAAFYVAEAGVEDARLTLFQADADRDPSNNLAAAAGPDHLIDFDPDAVRAVYDSTGKVTGFTGFDDDVPLRAPTSLGGGTWYAAFLTNDPLEGRTNLVDGNQRVMITAIGAGERRSLEVVQAIVEQHRVLPPVPPAAVIMLGPLPAFFDNGNSGAQTHTGNDCGVAGGAYAPIVGTVGPASRQQVQNDINRPENFSSGPFTGTATVGDLTNLSDPIVAAAGHGIIDPVWANCTELKALVEGLRQSANYYCNADVQSCSFSTIGANSVVFIDGDLSNTPNGTYSGILVVTGSLTYSGNTGWDGVVLVVGEGRVMRSGGGGGKPSGGLIIAAVDPTPAGPATDRSDWCTAGSGGYLRSFYDASGGGNSTVQWCSSKINSANDVRSYRIVEFRER